MPKLSAIEFFSPTRIYFGADVINRIGEDLIEVTDKVFIVTDGESMRHAGHLDKLETLLEKSGVEFVIYDTIPRDPANEIIDEVGTLIRQSRVKIVIALGGRSVINSAKAAAYLAKNEGSITDYLNGREGLDEAVSVITIPTIPGIVESISSEFVLKDSKDKVKKYYQNKSLYPYACYLDPSLTLSLPLNYTVGSGFAVLALAIESYISSAANTISDSLAIHAIEILGKTLKPLFLNKEDVSLRSSVLMASLLTSLALLTSSPGICHALALALSGKTNAYQNIMYAVILPHVMEFNLTAVPNKYVQIARALGEDISNITVVEAAIKAIEGVRKLLFDLKIPQRLSEYDIKKEDLPLVSGLARRYKFLSYTPSPITREDMLNILMTAY